MGKLNKQQIKQLTNILKNRKISDETILEFERFVNEHANTPLNTEKFRHDSGFWGTEGG